MRGIVALVREASVCSGSFECHRPSVRSASGTVPVVSVFVEPDGSPAAGPGWVVGVAVRAVQRGAGGAPWRVALGAALHLLFRSVPNVDRAASGPPRRPHLRGGGVSRDVAASRLGVRRVLSALPRWAAAGVPAVPAPEPVGLAAMG